MRTARFEASQRRGYARVLALTDMKCDPLFFSMASKSSQLSSFDAIDRAAKALSSCLDALDASFNLG